MSVLCRRAEDNSGFRYCIQERDPKTYWKKASIMRKKEEQKIDRQIQKKIYPLPFLKKILLGFEDETWLHLQPTIHSKNIHEKRGTKKDTSQRI